MEKINQFSLQRFALLIKRYAMFNLKSWLIGLGALAGVLIVVSALTIIFSAEVYRISGMVALGHVIIFTGGLLLASMAYNEIHTPAKSQFYLTLPATTAEKLFSHWIVTSVIFVVLANVLLSAVLFLTSGIAFLALSVPIETFNPFTTENLRIMSIYLVVHSIFFLGALYFRKNNFLKTILSLFVIQIVLNTFLFLLVYLVVGKEGFQGDMQHVNINLNHFATETFPLLMKIFFFGILGPFCLIVSYFRLKEREV